MGLLLAANGSLGPLPKLCARSSHAKFDSKIAATSSSGSIPALIAYLFFTSRVDRRVIEIDTLGEQVVELISAESLANRKESKRGQRKAA